MKIIKNDFKTGKQNHSKYLTSNRMYGRIKTDCAGEKNRHVTFKGPFLIVEYGNLEYRNDREEYFGSKVKSS